MTKLLLLKWNTARLETERRASMSEQSKIASLNLKILLDRKLVISTATTEYSQPKKTRVSIYNMVEMLHLRTLEVCGCCG